MKKLTALLALFLLLTLLAQGACAAAWETKLYSDEETFNQSESLLFGQLTADHSASDFEVRLRPLEISSSGIQSSFESYFQSDYPLAPGYTRKALYVNMGLWYNWDGFKELIQYPADAPTFDSGLIFNPIVPLSAFIPEGKTFQNLKVFHGTQSNTTNSPIWKPVKSVLHDGEPDFEDDGKTFTDNEVKVFPVTSDSDHYLRLSVGHFSPLRHRLGRTAHRRLRLALCAHPA